MIPDCKIKEQKVRIINIASYLAPDDGMSDGEVALVLNHFGETYIDEGGSFLLDKEDKPLTNMILEYVSGMMYGLYFLNVKQWKVTLQI